MRAPSRQTRARSGPCSQISLIFERPGLELPYTEATPGKDPEAREPFTCWADLARAVATTLPGSAAVAMVKATDHSSPRTSKG